MIRHTFAAALLACLCPALTGCGGNEFDVAPVRGTVTCGGQPLTRGVITFMPIAPDRGGSPGRAATGHIGPDGTFVLTTYDAEDGAIVGKHKVVYDPGAAGEGDYEEEEGEEGESAAPALPPPARPARGKRLPCQFGGQAEAEVVDGDNVLAIELTDWRPGQDDEEDSGRD